jgi:hypothetical protein
MKSSTGHRISGNTYPMKMDNIRFYAVYLVPKGVECMAYNGSSISESGETGRRQERGGRLYFYHSAYHYQMHQ